MHEIRINIADQFSLLGLGGISGQVLAVPTSNKCIEYTEFTNILRCYMHRTGMFYTPARFAVFSHYGKLLTFVVRSESNSTADTSMVPSIILDRAVHQL